MPFLTEEEKLFYKPQAKRTEPSVELSGVVPDSVFVPNKDTTSASRMINKIDLLNKGFAAIAKDYSKMLDVLKIRASYLDLNMPIASAANDNPALGNASLMLYGTLIDKFSFEQYIDLLLYGKQTSAEVVSVVAGMTNYDDIPKTLNGALASNPITASIQIITQEYGKFLVNSGNAEFLAVIQYISAISGANGHISALQNAKKSIKSVINIDQESPSEQQIQNSNTGTDKQFDGPIESSIAQLKNKKFAEWLTECFPCNFRAYQNGDVIDTVFEDWMNAMSASFFNSLSQLLNSKFPLLNLNIKNDLCSLISALVNFVCVPDLVSIVSMFTMMVAKLQAKLNIAFNVDFSFSITFISDLLANLLNLVFNKLSEIVNIIMSPIECVILSLNTQMSKLYLGEISKTATDFVNPKPYVDQFVNNLTETKNSIDATIRQFSDNIAKNLRWSKIKNSESTYLLFDLNNTKFLLSLVTEIVNISIAMHKISKNGTLAKLKPAEIIDYLCNSYTGGNMPWMEKVQIAMQEAQSAITSEISKLYPEERISNFSDIQIQPNIITPIPSATDITPSSYDLNKSISQDNDKIVVAVDHSISMEFFDNEATDLMDLPEYQELLSEVDYSKFENLEQGEANFKFDSEVLSKYNSNKQLLFDTYNQVNRKLSSPNGIELQFMPTTYIDFSNCYQNVGIDNYSESFINELINRVKQS